MTTKSLIPQDSKHYETLTKVVELHIQGNKPSQIATELKIKRADVLNYIDEFRAGAVSQGFMKDRVAELLSVLDEQYGTLIRKAYDSISSIETDIENNGATHQMLGQKTAALRLVADLEHKRIDVLQKAGLLDAADLGTEIAEMERQRDVILRILQEDLCEFCKPNVLAQLSDITGRTHVVEVKD